MRTALRHQLYRLGYWTLWASSFVIHRRARGTKCLLFNQGQVLLVRHTYGPRSWELPGGGVRRGEQPFDAMRRELREELQVDVAQARELGARSGPGRYAGTRISYFAAVLPDRSVVADPIEIADVAWFDPLAPPPRLGWNVAELLAEQGQSVASLPSDPGSPRRG
ncbi:MAG: NUDIX domain-containing protein [Solirubrobacteraceae bacterium]|jgi:8-oxo-dGTP pyrophosphatase MutT (NUDIX family)